MKENYEKHRETYINLTWIVFVYFWRKVMGKLINLYIDILYFCSNLCAKYKMPYI